MENFWKIIHKLLRNGRITEEERAKLDWFWENTSHQQKEEFIVRIGENIIPALRLFTVDDLID